MINISDINVGIIGLGAIATKMHIPSLSKIPEVQIKAAAEADLNRGKVIADKWNIPSFYDDYNKLYKCEDLDAVFICLPNFLHYAAVDAALDENINVFCEKPMGEFPNEAYNLVKKAKKNKLILAVGYNRRLEKNYLKLQKIVSSMKLGNILQLNINLMIGGPYAGWAPSSDWFFNQKYGVLYDSGSHLIDMVHYILGENIVEVSAQGINTYHGIKTLDNISGTFITKNNTLGSFNIGWRSGVNYDSIKIFGTGCSVFAEPNQIEFIHGGTTRLTRAINHIKLSKDILSSMIGKSEKDKALNDTYYMEDKSFVESLSGTNLPIVSGEDALRIIEVLDAIKKSVENNSKEKVYNRVI